VTTGTLDTAIMAAYAMLGGAGGTIDCTGRQGTQTLAADPFAAMMGPVTVLLPPVGITLMVPINIPNNVLVQYTGGVNIDIQSTVTACTTPAAPGATCTVQVTNNFGAANQETFCNFRDMPSVNIGFPVVLKVANLDLNNVTVTIGTYNGLPAGGGTLVCSTNVAH
jgi:hypothetical protein